MDGTVTIKAEIDTKDAERDINSLVDYLKYAEEKAGRKLTEQEKQQLEEIYWNAQELGMRIEQGLNQAEDGLKNIGNSIKKVIKNVTRWGLAIFGIRGAYMAVRNAINVISQGDEQLKADIDYIKNAIAYTLEPVVRKIVELAKQLLFYIGWLIKQWTGHNIFENANKSLKKSVGSAKELKKQLAGFDEMNVLSDDSGGGGGATTPSFDLSAIDKIEPPQWLVTIRDIGQWVIDHWEEVVFALLLTKLFIDLITGNWIGVVIDFLGLLVVAFFKLKDAVAVVFESLFEIWALFVAYITTKWVELKEAWAEFTAWLLEKWLDFVEWITNKWNNFTTWISDTVKKIGAFFSNLWQGVKEAVANTVQWVKDKFSSIVSFFSGLINKIISLFKTIGTKVGDAIGGAFKSVINGVLKAIENILNFPIRSINKLIDVINAVPGIDISTLPTFKLPRLAKGGIVNLPGKGVPIGGLAKTGEVSPEGVIPLTDSQQMELLGQSIGKYVTINATIPVYAYNRVVDRQIKRIKAEDEFAGNR